MQLLSKRIFVGAIGAVAVMLSTAHCVAEAAVAWDKTFAEEGTSFTPGPIAISPTNGHLFLGVTASIPGKEGSGRFLVWEINSHGDIINTIKIGQVPEGASIAHDVSQITTLQVMRDGSLMAVVEFDGSTPHLIKATPQGKIIFTKRILEKHASVDLVDMEILDDDSVVLVGRKNHNAVAVRVDASGDMIWSKEFERGEMRTRFTKAIVLSDSVVLVGWGINIKEPRTAVIVIKVDKQANRLEEIVYDAAPYVDAVKTDDQKFAVVYNSQKNGVFATRVREFNGKLKQLHDEVILPEKEKAQRYRLSRLNNGFVAAGCDWSNLHVVRLKKTLEVMSVYQTDAMNYSMCHTQLAVQDSNVYVFLRSAEPDQPKLGQVRSIAFDTSEQEE